MFFGKSRYIVAEYFHPHLAENITPDARVEPRNAEAVRACEVEYYLLCVLCVGFYFCVVGFVGIVDDGILDKYI